MPFPVPIFYSFNNHDAILPRGIFMPAFDRMRSGRAIFMPKTRKNKKGEPNERKENAADAKKTLESIPADYSALSGKVDENANGISELKEDLVDYRGLSRALKTPHWGVFARRTGGGPELFSSPDGAPDRAFLK